MNKVKGGSIEHNPSMGSRGVYEPIKLVGGIEYINSTEEEISVFVFFSNHCFVSEFFYNFFFSILSKCSWMFSDT